MNQIIQFFIGKGGVGKSTTSALTALRLAESGHDTLLVSMDPAHNQRDIFRKKFSEKPQQVQNKLAVKEIDQDYWIAAYLKETQKELKKTYSYQSAFNIQNYFNILKFSPGLEEIALVRAFEHTLLHEKQRKYILFDMPPTALTLRFFSLPFITRIWLNELLKLRNEIYKKKEIVSKIQFGKKTIEQDKVQSRLKTLIDDHRVLRERLTAETAEINLVLNCDRLSFSEAKRIRQKLTEIGMDIERILVNKVTALANIDDITKAFSDYPVCPIPLSSCELSGLPSLQKHIQKMPFFPLSKEKGVLKNAATM
jgi:arsenite-transporting ATPase